MSSKNPIAEFKIYYTRFLDPDGKVEEALPAFAKDTEKLISFYRMMVKTRIFDAKAIALQRTGKLGTYPSILGQEAIGVGVGAAMQDRDVLCPYYRDCGAQFWRGVKMSDILLYWGGDERGSDFANAREDFPICVPIASQTLHAVGVATAMKLRKEPRVAVTMIGDGGTSRGDFYEAMNWAGSAKLPVLFVINNNQWAISVPRHEQTAAQTLAQKGIAVGIPSEQIDGNDVIAVYNAAYEAIERARRGEGPSLIEAMSYRMGDHTTADDAKRYRPNAELDVYQKADPIKRLCLYLKSIHVWDEAQEKNLEAEANAEVNAMITDYLGVTPVGPEALFDYLYAKLPETLTEQREAALQLKEHHLHD